MVADELVVRMRAKYPSVTVCVNVGYTILPGSAVSAELEAGTLSGAPVCTPDLSRRVVLARAAARRPSPASVAAAPELVGLMKELVLRDAWPGAVLLVLAFTAGGSLYFYTFTTYMQKFLVVSVGLPVDTVSFVMTAALHVECAVTIRSPRGAPGRADGISDGIAFAAGAANWPPLCLLRGRRGVTAGSRCCRPRSSTCGHLRWPSATRQGVCSPRRSASGIPRSWSMAS